MIIKKEIEENIEILKKDESHIEYFKKLFLNNLRANPKDVKIIIEEVINICKESNYFIAYAWCLIYLGWYYHISCNYKEAIKRRLEAYDIFSKNNFNNGIIVACSALLADFCRVGNFELAIEYGLVGIELSEAENDEISLVSIMINTSIAYIECRKYKESRNLLEKIPKFHGNISKEAILSYYITLAEVELNTNNIESAYSYCEKSYELVRELKCWVYECEVLSILAVVNYKLGNHEEAEGNFKLAIENAQRFNNNSFVVKTLKRWSQYYMEINKLDNVEEMLMWALEESNKINSLIDKSEIYYELSEFYDKVGRTKEAYKFLKEHLKIEKKIFNNRSSSSFAKLNNKEVTREAKIYKELYQQIDLISEIGKKLTSDLKIERSLNVIYDEVCKMMEADIFGIAKYSEEKDCLNYELFIIDGNRKDYGDVPIDEESLGTWCFKNAKNIVINDLDNEYENYITKKEIKKVNNVKKANTIKKVNSLIFCPLIIENKVIGILSVQSYKKQAYDKNDIKKLEILTSYITIALENAKLFNSIEYSATHDELTDVFNRKEILKKGEELINNFERSSVIMMDIDYFKSINDSYGHSAGDYVLKKLSNILKNIIKDNGYIGRYGGEEFLIILKNNHDKNSNDIAEKMRYSIEKYEFILNEHTIINVTASFGVYNFNYENKEFYKGIKLADKALYIAKSLGRNKVVLHEEVLEVV